MFFAVSLVGIERFYKTWFTERLPFVMCIDRDAPVVFTAEAPVGAVITWNIPTNWVFALSGPGNNTLSLFDILPPPPDDFEIITISATSSLGGQSDFAITIYCLEDQWLCGEQEGGGASQFNAPVSSFGSFLEELPKEFEIFPNPSEDIIRIVAKESMISFVDVISISGAIIQKILVNDKQKTVNFSDLEPGYYFLQIHHERGVDVLHFIKI
ncbi:MAG TPA: T9SS type A sorting domain-containing protein [Saprospiraceae bacterium]|nr:T9SS type A sorting domain-containing protein [Saprospiraceae bacterium]